MLFYESSGNLQGCLSFEVKDLQNVFTLDGQA